MKVIAAVNMELTLDEPTQRRVAEKVIRSACNLRPDLEVMAGGGLVENVRTTGHRGFEYHLEPAGRATELQRAAALVLSEIKKQKGK